MKQRLVFNIIFFIAVLSFPWWFIFFIGGIGAFVFVPYYEIFVFGLLFDLLYGTSASPLFGMAGFVISIILFWIMVRLKKSIRTS